jgi:cyclopropane fatty-acyl-phospholipid synthase-like methyltransferase
MGDIRYRLYEHYVSRFKRYQIGLDEAGLRPYWHWCDFKYLPALRDVKPDDPILELGCGPGYMLEYLLRQGYTNIQGIDISQEQVDIAVSRGLPAATAEVFQFLEGKKDQYAAIIALDFVEHFTREELFKLFPLIYGALRKDGLFLVQTPNGQALFPGQVVYGDLTHMTIFTESSMTQLLSFFGFRDIHFRETGPIPDTLAGKARTFLWKVTRTVARKIRQIEVDYPTGIWTENFICWAQK